MEEPKTSHLADTGTKLPFSEEYVGGSSSLIRRKNELLTREQEAKKRGGELSLEEKAELEGLLVFPNNWRAALLLMNDLLGKTTEEEKRELTRYYRFREFSPEMIALWDRVEAGDPNVVEVDMNQGKAINVSTTDEEKVIWTSSLNGCSACLVYTEHPNGTRNAVLTHYQPTEIFQNLDMLQQLIGSIPNMKEAITKQVVLVVPAGWVQDPTTKKYSLEVINQRDSDLLVLAVQAAIDAKVNVSLEPYQYPVAATPGKKDQGTLVVYIPPQGKGEVRYKTWFSSGTLGNPEQKK